MRNTHSNFNNLRNKHYALRITKYFMVLTVNIYNQKGEKKDKMDLPEFLFDVGLNVELIQQARVAQMANQRQVLAHTKTRSEVRGGGRKPWRQKGTGNARAGSIRSPIWVGGGITFGPNKERNFAKKINKKMKRKAIFMALTDKFKNNSLLVVDKLEMTEFSTKGFINILVALEKQLTESKQDSGEAEKRSLLMVNEEINDKLKYSANNLTRIKILSVNNINILDLLRYKDLVMSVGAIKKLKEIYNK